jgi:hypothetical protein
VAEGAIPLRGWFLTGCASLGRLDEDLFWIGQQFKSSIGTEPTSLRPMWSPLKVRPERAKECP